MKSMLILTDFSEDAFRAAEYACQLAGPLHIQRVVLYHAYQAVMAVTDIPAFATVNSDQQFYQESMESLGMWQDRLKPMLEHTVTIDMVAEDTTLANLPDLINQRTGKEGIDLIVMGVSGKTAFEKLLVGSTTAEILRKGEWPVLVVPRDILLGKPIKTIVFASDLRGAGALPADQLYEVLNALPGKLQVINVARKATEKYAPETEKEIAGLHELLKNYDPSFHYITGDDIVAEMLAFAEQQQASLIITVHQKHGFLFRLFHESITKKLAYNSRIPLLSLPGGLE